MESSVPSITELLLKIGVVGFYFIGVSAIFIHLLRWIWMCRDEAQLCETQATITCKTDENFDDAASIRFVFRARNSRQYQPEFSMPRGTENYYEKCKVGDKIIICYNKKFPQFNYIKDLVGPTKRLHKHFFWLLLFMWVPGCVGIFVLIKELWIYFF